MQLQIAAKLTNKIKTSFSRLKKAEKFLVFALIFVLLFNLCFNKLLKPQLKKLSALKSEFAGLDRQIMNLKAKLPPIEEEQAKLEELKKTNHQLQERLASLEKELPGFYKIPELLGKLAKQTQDFQIDFSYIKPKTTQAAGEGDYTWLNIEMQFDAPYSDFRGYLGRLERISSYLNITDILIEEMKEGSFAGETTATVVLSALLTKDSGKLKAFLGEEKKDLLSEVEQQRNPFVPSDKQTTSYSPKQKYYVSGISFAGAKSTAIINNEVYREGDSLEKKYAIKQILPNMVIIKHGGQTEALVLK